MMKKLIARTLAVTTLVGTFATVPVAFGDDAKVPATAAATAAHSDAKPETKPDAMRVSEDGFMATRAMHSARVAIFNGDPKLCNEMLAQAKESLDKADKDESVAKVKNDLIPIDGSLALADTFVPSPEKAEHVAKANEHFQKGEAGKGVEHLRLGEIEVNFSRVLMPLGATKKRLADAMNLVSEHKYYEANLALKAAEEGLEFDSVSLFEHPIGDAPAKAAALTAKSAAPAKAAAPAKSAAPAKVVVPAK